MEIPVQSQGILVLSLEVLLEINPNGRSVYPVQLKEGFRSQTELSARTASGNPTVL